MGHWAFYNLTVLGVLGFIAGRQPSTVGDIRFDQPYEDTGQTLGATPELLTEASGGENAPPAYAYRRSFGTVLTAPFRGRRAASRRPCAQAPRRHTPQSPKHQRHLPRHPSRRSQAHSRRIWLDEIRELEIIIRSGLAKRSVSKTAHLRKYDK